ncbi:3-keto-5-aminohexanoate cleavage protein [Emcibacter sp.]|uniref:3-keto-5-aminohexanoate cleavage protein n=1 Tax=Emcibacter sp. TaxID=1979954 RepID=UPI002AA849CA|nr:3-keto-5-aminohexanoate cleavage protein [Emcibacter sp.]
MTSDFRAFARDKIMIMAAPNGARRTHADHPALPMTPGELAECAEQVMAAGASVLHLHVRNDDGSHSLDADRYRAAIGAIRDRVGDGLVLQATTEAVGIYNRDQQMAMVRDLRPEAVSLALRELCPTDAEEQEAGDFFDWCVREQIWPQYILYSPEEAARFERLRRKGLFGQEHPSALFVLGRYSADLTGDVQQILSFLNVVEEASVPWTCCCFGRTEAQAMLEAACRGGHTRIGFENNLELEDGSPAPNNAALIRQLVDSLPLSNRTAANADEVRSIFCS